MKEHRERGLVNRNVKNCTEQGKLGSVSGLGRRSGMLWDGGLMANLLYETRLQGIMGLDICFGEYNYHDSLQACLIVRCTCRESW